MGGTTILNTLGKSVIMIGASADQACYASNHGPALALTGDAVKETTTVRVASGAASFAGGDLALIDEADDAVVQEGDCQYFTPASSRRPPSSARPPCRPATSRRCSSTPATST
jgi:hypothetical protein